MRTLIAMGVALLFIITALGKDRKGKVNADMPYIDYVLPDERTAYFVGDVLLTNDTVKIGEFLAAGININGNAKHADATPRYYKSILMFAIDRCNIHTVGYLLRHGADPNLRIRTKWKPMFKNEYYDFSMYPLEQAAEENSIEKMELLVAYGADIKRCIEGLKSIATTKGNTTMMDYLSKSSGQSAIQPNVLAVMTEPDILRTYADITPEFILKMAAGGADVNAFTSKGKTALLNVIQNGALKNKSELILALIKSGANVNLPDREDPGRLYLGFYPTSPLKAAIEHGNLEIVKLLVENGANINQSDGGHTPLKTATYKPIKEYLILKGAK